MILKQMGKKNDEFDEENPLETCSTDLMDQEDSIDNQEVSSNGQEDFTDDQEPNQPSPIGDQQNT